MLTTTVEILNLLEFTLSSRFYAIISSSLWYYL